MDKNELKNEEVAYYNQLLFTYLTQYAPPGPSPLPDWENNPEYVVKTSQDISDEFQEMCSLDVNHISEILIGIGYRPQVCADGVIRWVFKRL